MVMPVKIVLSAICLLLFFCFITPVSVCDARTVMNLNGTWEKLSAEKTIYPPAGEWQTCIVPSTVMETNYGSTWYKKNLTIPKALDGNRIKLYFNGSKFNTKVFVNGHYAGNYLGGYEPFTIDITSFVKFGTNNELLVNTETWTALFNKKINLKNLRPGEHLRQKPKDAVIAPIGGRFNFYGIWDDISLIACNAVHVDDIFIKTSTRNKTITVDVEIINESNNTVSAKLMNTVKKNQQDILHIPEKSITIKPKARKKISATANWSNPELWTYKTPNLYHLATALIINNETADLIQTRFGFREFWTEGTQFILNGTPITLFGTSNWPNKTPMTPAEIKYTIQQIKAANTNTFRCHTQPWRKIWYDTADEMGLLMISEFAVWNDDHIYRILDPAFWNNYAEHIKRSIKRDKNHPSIIMWSVENEMHGSRLNGASPAYHDLIKMGELTKKTDPTRAITYESDLDPGGIADVLGIHYPHEFPQYNQWPNTAYWMDNDISMPYSFTNGTGKWFWERHKPLYIGEFLWSPMPVPEGDTILLGDNAYTEFPQAHNQALARIWQMQIEAYRSYGVSGMCPWTMFLGGKLDDSNPLYTSQKSAFHPQAVFLKEYDSRFYSGETVKRTLVVYNNTLTQSHLKLNWSTTTGNNTVIEKDTVLLTLEPAEKHTIEIDLHLPEIDKKQSVFFSFNAIENTSVHFTDTKHYTVEPKIKLQTPKAIQIALFDPVGDTAAVFSKNGISFDALRNLKFADADLIVIGRHAFKKPQKTAKKIIINFDNYHQLARYLYNGGKVLVLPQQFYPETMLPAQLTHHASTITFMMNPGHKLFKGLTSEDLRFWRGDNIVTEKEPRRPVSGKYIPLALSGSQSGLSNAPIIEFPYGKGVLMLCQMKLLEKFDTEPAAAKLFQNIMDHLAGYHNAPAQTAVVSNDTDFNFRLTSLHLKFDTINGNFSDVDLKKTGILIFKEDFTAITPNIDKIDLFLKNGGKLLLHGVNADNLHDIAPLLPENTVLRNSNGPVLKSGTDPVTASLLNEDLFWFDPHAFRSWEAPATIAPDIIDSVISLEESLPAKNAAGTFYPLTNPPALVKYQYGKGFILIDQVKWYKEHHNFIKASRYASEILTGLNADFFLPVFVTIEAEIMKKQPGLKGYVRQPQHIEMKQNGYLSQKIKCSANGNYILEIIARGRPAFNVFPKMDILIDDKTAGSVQLSSKGWRVYRINVGMTRGNHEIKFSYVNALHKPPHGRNIKIDKVLIYPANLSSISL